MDWWQGWAGQAGQCMRAMGNLARLLIRTARLPCTCTCSAKKWGDVEFPLPFGRIMTPQVRPARCCSGKRHGASLAVPACRLNLGSLHD